jgi:hypothetical protein
VRQPCDLILTNALVLTMDERFTVHAAGSVAITGDSIVAVGDIASDWDAADTLDCGPRGGPSTWHRFRGSKRHGCRPHRRSRIRDRRGQRAPAVAADGRLHRQRLANSSCR